MDTLRWLRKNGNIIGVEVAEIEYNLIGIMNNPALHGMYHEQIKKDKEGRDEEINVR